MAEIADILNSLLQKARQDSISWQHTADESTFTAVLGNSSVIIFHDYSGFVLKILNKEGREIDRLDSGRIYDAQFEEALQELYYKSKRIALRVENELDELLKELETGT